MMTNPATPYTNYPLIGVLGGMGPAATADFYLKVIAETKAQCDQEHIPLLIHAVPQIPDRSTFLLKGGASPAPFLIAAAQKLEKAGAKAIAIACNTAHFWHAEIQANVNIPVLHIVACVLNAAGVAAATPKKLGLLGTAATLTAGLYQNYSSVPGIEWMTPAKQDIENLVTPGIHAVKAGDLARGRQLLAAAADRLVEQGAQAIVQACTEIPIVLNDYARVPTLDATLILAQNVVQWARDHVLESA